MYDSIRVSSEPWSAMIPGNHPLAVREGSEVNLRELVGHPLIIPSRKSRTKEILGWFDKIGQEPTILCELSHYLNAFELVKQGVGIAIFPASTGANIQNEGVVMKKIVNPEYRASYVLIWDRSKKLSTPAEKFLEYVRDEWKEQP